MERSLYITLKQQLGNLDVAQGGFQESKSTLDQVLVLDSMIKLYNPVICCLDIKGAYDTVNRIKLWEKLRVKNISPAIIKILQALFDNISIKIRVNSKYSHEYSIDIGILQGSVLSPLLYISFMDDLPNKLREAGGFVLNEKIINSIIFADDISLIGQNKVHLQKLLDICDKHSKDNKYEFQPEKSEVMGLARNQIVKLSSNIKKVNSIKYLGIWFNKNGIDQKKHFGSILNKFQKRISICNKSGILNDYYYPKVVMTVLKVMIRPVFEYGMAVMVLSKNYQNEIQCRMLNLVKQKLHLPKSTSGNAIIILTSIMDVATRNDFLTSSYYAKALDRIEDNSFLTSWLFNELKNREEVQEIHPTLLTVSVYQNVVWKKILDEKIRVGAEQFKTVWNKENVFKQKTILDYFIKIQLIDQKVVSRISWVGGLNPILKMGDNTLNAKKRRRLLLWRVGLIPGHSRNRRFCKKCNLEMNGSHYIHCIDIDSIMRDSLEYCCLLKSPLKKHGTIVDSTIDLISNDKLICYEQGKWEPILKSIDLVCEQMLGLL